MTSLEFLTFVGTLTDGTEVPPPSINEPGIRIHVCLAAVTPDGACTAMVHQMQGVLGQGRTQDSQPESDLILHNSLILTSFCGTCANGWMTRPMGILQLFSMSLEQGTVYMVALT